MKEVERRVRRQLLKDRKDTTDLLKSLGRQHLALCREHAAKLAEWVAHYDGAVRGEIVSAAVRRRAWASLDRLAGIVTTLEEVAIDRAEAEKRLRKLDSASEFRRRLKRAEDFAQRAEDMGASRRRGGAFGVSGKEAAEIVLLQEGGPLHYSDITVFALETGLVRMSGKTPENTMSAYLSKAVVDGDTFVRVRPGEFDLASRKNGGGRARVAAKK